MSKFMLLFISIMVIVVIPLESFGETIEIDGEKYTITPFEDVTEETIEINCDKYTTTPIKETCNTSESSRVTYEISSPYILCDEQNRCWVLSWFYQLVWYDVFGIIFLAVAIFIGGMAIGRVID